MADQATTGIQHITDDQFDELVLKSKKPVMVDFYAQWCGPCKMAAPILEELAEEQSDVTIVKIDVDENPKSSQQYDVMSIPTVIVFKNGEEFERQIGFAGRGGYEELIENAKN